MDVRVMAAVVVSLGVVAALCIGGIVIADAMGHQPPNSLGTIAGTCIGALAMLLVNPNTRGDGLRAASPLNILNTPK